MQSKNKAPMKADERRHVARVKALPCSLCDKPSTDEEPSEAHEIQQGLWWLAISLCASCHRGPKLGLHGEKRMWAIKKLDELGALAITIKRLMTT